MAEWTRQYIDSLPDAAFAVVLPGGRKDEEGKTVPRSLRKLPHHDHTVSDGREHDTVDLPHLRNALARLARTELGDEAHRRRAREHLERHARALGVGRLAEEENGEGRRPEEALLTERASALPRRVEDGVLRGVVVIRGRSANGRLYPPETLRRALPLFEGCRVFANHATGSRDVRDLVGVLRRPWFDGEAVRADLEVIEGLAPWLTEIARRAPEALGLSINARGRLSRRGELDVVEEISRLISVDVVAEPAAVGGLFEEREEERRRLQSLEEEKERLEEELAELRRRLQALEEEKRLAEEKRRLARLARRRGLPEHALSETFLSLLAAAGEEERARLIEDRRELLRRAAAPSSSRKELLRAPAADRYLAAIKD